MGERRSRGFAAVMAVMLVAATGCGGDGAETTAATEATTTTAAPTTTTTSTTTTTTTTIPTTGTIEGTLFLQDREEPILTTVELVSEASGESEVVQTVAAGDDGAYTLMAEPGTYTVRVNLTEYVDRCTNLRSAPVETANLWPVVIRTYNAGGMTDVYAGSGDVSVEIGDVVTMDLILLCDE